MRSVKPCALLSEAPASFCIAGSLKISRCAPAHPCCSSGQAHHVAALSSPWRRGQWVCRVLQALPCTLPTLVLPVWKGHMELLSCSRAVNLCPGRHWLHSGALATITQKYIFSWWLLRFLWAYAPWGKMCHYFCSVKKDTDKQILVHWTFWNTDISLGHETQNCIWLWFLQLSWNLEVPTNLHLEHSGWPLTFSAEGSDGGAEKLSLNFAPSCVTQEQPLQGPACLRGVCSWKVMECWWSVYTDVN